MRDESEDDRRESLAERDDRNLNELIQELRVVGLGVQVLFGFLLSLPFTARFDRLSHGQRGLYLTSLMLAAIAVTLLLGPVAYHRLVFRRGQKERLVRFANRMAILGLTAVGAAVLTAVLLVTSYVVGTLTGALITALLGCMLVTLWFALPLVRRHEEPLPVTEPESAARPHRVPPTPGPRPSAARPRPSAPDIDSACVTRDLGRWTSGRSLSSTGRAPSPAPAALQLSGGPVGQFTGAKDVRVVPHRLARLFTPRPATFPPDISDIGGRERCKDKG